MSFLAKLYMDDQEFNILDTEYVFNQNTDAHGKPAAKTKGGRLFITIESTASLDFFDWMITPTAIKSGKITFFRRESEAKMKDLAFNDAYCISFKEKFVSTGDNPMIIDLEISAKELKMGEALFNNPWTM